MWKLYDELIAAIPKKIKITDIYQTERWTLISSDYGIGTAMKFTQELIPLIQEYKGMEIAQVAPLIKSWDFQEASIGLAAMNSYFNQLKQIEKNFSSERMISSDAFDDLVENAKTNKIGMIGHFPFVDRLEEYPENVYIFELEPRKGDYPASASEFLLPQMDIVYITGSTLVNKTIVRLLELTKQAKVILVGSSCPLSPTLFNFSIDVLAGTIYQESVGELAKKHFNKHFPLSKQGLPVMVYHK